MSALELLNRLQENGLLSTKVAEKIRQQVEVAPKEVTAAALAKLLVKKGQLTPTQAKLALESLPPPPPLLRDDDDLGLRDDEADEVVEPVEAEVLEEPPEAIAIAEPVADQAAPWGESLGEGEMDAPHDPALDEIHDDQAAGRTLVTRKRGLAGLLQSLRPGGGRKISANRWDSPLMLVGGGSLAVMIFVGVALYFFLSRGTGDDAYNAANESYRQGAYGQAISQFQSFINDFPDHPRVSSARVRIGTAKIWSDVERRQWDAALTTVRQELPPIVGEVAFEEIRPELASLLPEIMDGFATAAEETEDVAESEKLMQLANETLGEVNNAAYLPTSVRRGQQPRIEAIQATLEGVKRRIDQDRQLVKVVDEIRQAAASGQVAAAYDLRKALLKDYPRLEVDQRLVDAVRSVADTERQAVTPISDPPAPLTEDRPVASQFRVVFAERRGASIDSLGDDLLFVLAEGNVYGIRAADGSVAWRRHVGLDTLIQPMDLKPVGTADALVVDATHQELLRLEHTTGKLVWRLPCPGPLTAPRLVGGRIVVGYTVEGRGTVMAVDPADGRVIGGAQLPLPVEVGPVVDLERQVVYQPASRSSLYRLSWEDWSCQGVTYLGHAARTIVVPPEMIGDNVLVAENPGLDFSLLHVLRDNPEQPGVLSPLAKPHRMNGQVVVPMVPFGRRVLMTTDQGRLVVLELDVNQPEPLRVAAEAVATVERGTVSYPVLAEGRLWIGDNQLTHYELQISRGQFARKWLNSKGDRFLAPMQLRGNVLFHVRRAAGKSGVAIAAVAATGSVDRASAGETVWETILGAPAIGAPMVDRAKQEIRLVTGNGTLFSVGKQAIRDGLDQQPVQQLFDPQLGRLATSLELDASRFAFFPEPSQGGDRFALYDAQAKRDLLRVVALPGASLEISGTPAVLQGNLLLPSRTGSVHLIDPASGNPAAAPFLPTLAAGATVQWKRPFLLPSGDQALLANAQGDLYHLELRTNPQPHLAAIRQQQGDVPLVADPVVMGESILAIVRGAQGDVLRRYRLADLLLDQQQDLPGRVIWGPYVAGSLVLMMTDQDHLIAVNDQKDVFVRSDLNASLVGEPLVVDRTVVLSTVNGDLLQISSDTGQDVTRVELGERLASGPVPFAANRYLVCAADGTLHIVPLESRSLQARDAR